MKDAQAAITNEELFDKFNTVVSEAEQLLKSFSSTGSERAGALKADVERRLADAGERLAKIREDAFGQAAAAVRATDEYVHRNPWRVAAAAALLAAIAGLAAGVLIARR